jgi:branched-chain amino acid transport system substrate-binding protein
MARKALFAFAALLLGNGASAAPRFDGVIHVGYSGPLSGGAAKYGENCLTGAKIAVEDVNAAGGVAIKGKRYELKLTHYDDMYKPANTVANVRRMISTAKPIAVLCPHAGGILALEKINEAEGFIVSGYTTNVDILAQNNKLVFSVPPRGDLAYSVELTRRATTYGKKLALLTGTHEAAVFWTKKTEEAWKKFGGEVVAVDSVNYMGVTDFYPYLTKALKANPDVISLYGPSEPAAMIVNQARELGYKGAFLMGDQIKLDEMAKVASMDNLNNSIGVSPFDRRPLPIAQAFGKRLQKLYGAEYVPTFEAAAHYEVVWLLVKAMEKAQEKDDPKAIFARFNDVLPLGEHAMTQRDGIGPNGELLGVTFGMEVKNAKFSEAIPLVWGKEFYQGGKTSAWK